MKVPLWPGVGSWLRDLLVPTSNRRSPATLALILVVLLLTGLPLGWLGIEDIRGALTYAGRITGAILILVSVTTLVGAVAAWDHWFRNRIPYSGTVALIGTVAAFLTNAALLLMTFKDVDSTAYRVLWCLITAGCAWAVFAVWRTSVEIPAPKRVAAALIATGLIAMANFGYERLYQPYQHSARPLITMTVRKPVLREDRKAFALPVDIRAENRSDVGFYVLGTEFHAMGERVQISATDRKREQWRDDAEKWRPFQEKHPLSRREIQQPGELVAAQPWAPAGHWIEPGDTFVTQTVVQLPMDTPYDQLAFYAQGSFARKDRLGLSQMQLTGYSWSDGQVPDWVRATKDVDNVVYRGRVSENNAIAAYTRDTRYVTVYWQFGVHGAGLLQAIRRKGEENRVNSESEDRESESRYGIIDSMQGPIERTLWDVKGRH
ncbi:hypothetical protein OG698_09930 [Streptomyces sp. NBC_01003]|uniref:hypothetical protein n=1 Tax=Streptomyces sp. NBC_01003 TaxID=2903714 RepID=UPI0038686430|nr:hypothetical protein OG698_09930 [Streptomyces sp. NBC_01003]